MKMFEKIKREKKFHNYQVFLIIVLVLWLFVFGFSSYEIVLAATGPMAGEEFELEVTGFEDVLDDGSYPVRVSSDIEGEDDVMHFSIEFSEGNAYVPVEFETATSHELTVLVDNEHEEVIEVEVNPGMVEEVVIEPVEEQLINLRQSITFKAQAFDGYRNLITDEASDFEWQNTDQYGLFTRNETGIFDVSAELEGISTETVLVEVEIVDFSDHSGNIRTLAFGPEDLLIASGSYDGTVKVWDIASKEVIVDFNEHENNVRAVDFSPEGDRVVSAGVDNTVKVWDAESGEVLVDFLDHDESAYTAAFCPQGDRIVSGGWDQKLKVWDARSGEVIDIFEDFSASVRTATFSPDGNLLAAGSWNGELIIWDLVEGELVLEQLVNDGSVETISFAPEAGLLAAGSSEGLVSVLDVDNEDNVLEIDLDGTWVWAVDFSPVGDGILVALDNGEVLVLDMNSGEERFIFEEHSESVRAAAFSNDGEWIASGGNDENVKVYRWE